MKGTVKEVLEKCVTVWITVDGNHKRWQKEVNDGRHKI